MAFTWVLPSPASSEAEALLESVEAGAGPVVPPLWYLEVVIGPLAAERRRLVTGDERRQSSERLSAPAFSVVEDDARNAFGRTSSLAEQYDLSVYDAAYLEFALRRNLPLSGGT